MTHRTRYGSVLVVALALLILGTALLIGSSASERSATRAVRSHEALAFAVAESRAQVAGFVGRWGSSADALPVGGEQIAAMAARTGGVGALPVVSSLRLKRISTLRYVLSVETTVGPPGAPLGMSRLRTLLQRPILIDTTAHPGPPTPTPRWAINDLF